MKTPQKFYIKERHNGQSGPYYVACGQLSKAAAKRMGKSLHGTNFMHSFDTVTDYAAKLAQLRSEGNYIQ